MKRLLSLLVIGFCMFGIAKAQFLVVNVSFTDTFNVAPNFTVNASIRQSDSASNPNGLSLLVSHATGGSRIDSFSVNSGYTGNQITVNYQDCGVWKKYTTTYSGSYVNIQITLQCSSECNAAFNHYDTAKTAYFFPVSYHPSLQHTWYFGDGDSSNSITINHTYAQPGVYLAQHKVRATNGHCEETLSDTVRVSYPCNSQFSVSASFRNLQVQAQQNHAFITHNWSFGDGQTSSSVNPSHVYNQDGAYGISHTVTDIITNCSSTSYDTVFINTNCDAYFGVREIQLTDATVWCKDSSVRVTQYPSTYTWDFGDSSTGSGNYTAHTYQRPDSFTIKLLLQNGSCTDSFSRRVGLGFDCTTPTMHFSNYFVDSLRYNFFVQNLRPFTTYTWQVEDSTYTSAGFMHTFRHTGPHVIKLNWDNGHGCQDSASLNINVTVDTQVYITKHNVFQITPGASWYRVELVGGGYKKQQLVVLDYQDTILGLNAGSYWFPSLGWHYVYHKVYNDFTSASALDSFYVSDTSQCKLVLERLINSDSNLIRYSTNNSAINTYRNHVTYNWDLDGGEFKQFFPSSAKYIFFPDSGTYTIKLEISDSNGYCVNQKDSILVYVPKNSPCTAEFDYEYITPNKLNFEARYKGLSSTYYKWNFANSINRYGENQTYTFNNPGLQEVKLTINTSTCRDTVIKWIPSYPPCSSTPQVIGLGNFGFDFKSSAAPSNLQPTWWYVSSGNYLDSIQGDSLTYTFPSPGTYLITSIRLNSNGVQICTNSLSLTINHCGNNINSSERHFVELEFDGQVLTDYDSMRVYFISVDSTNWTIGAIDSITVYSGIDSGIWVDRGCIQSPRNYTLVKGALLPGSKYYSDYLPTYMTHSALWTGSDKITFNYYGSQGPFTLNMIKGTNPGGPGFIGGFVSQGANKNGAGLDGIQVNLFDPNDNPVAVTYTFNAGRYEFKDLAYGTYKVSVDIPGKSTATYFITLSSSNPKSDEMNFEVNTQTIDLKALTVQLPKSTFRIYPNPVKNQLTIESEGSVQVSRAEIRDMSGKIIPLATEKNAHSLKLNLGELPNGVYLVYVYSDEAFTVYKINKSE